MSAFAGRKLRISYYPSGDGSGAATTIAKAKSDDFDVTNEPIDSTGKDDAGVKKLLNDIGSQAWSGNVAGLITDAVLLGLAANAGEDTALHWFKITVGGLGDLEGLWFISNFKGAGSEGAEAATFECALTSADNITWTAAS
jgi:predicted secreted protein